MNSTVICNSLAPITIEPGVNEAMFRRSGLKFSIIVVSMYAFYASLELVRKDLILGMGLVVEGF